jgi:hypothetical protein
MPPIVDMRIRVSTFVDCVDMRGHAWTFVDMHGHSWTHGHFRDICVGRMDIAWTFAWTNGHYCEQMDIMDFSLGVHKLLNRKVKKDRNDDNYTEVILCAALACCINPLTKTGRVQIHCPFCIALLPQLLEQQFHVCPFMLPRISHAHRLCPSTTIMS